MYMETILFFMSFIALLLLCNGIVSLFYNICEPFRNWVNNFQDDVGIEGENQ